MIFLIVIVNYSPVFCYIVTFSKKPLVGIIMGSSSDSRIMQGAAEILDEFKIKHEDQIVSAHRTPSRLAEYATITEMPTGSPVVSVGVNKAGNAGIYAIKILANEFQVLKKKLKQHKSNQHNSVIKESEQLKKQGLSKFAKKKFK